MSRILITLLAVIFTAPIMVASAGGPEPLAPEDTPEVYRRSLPLLELDGIDLPLVKAVNIIDYLQLMGGGVSLNSEASTKHIDYLQIHMRDSLPIQFRIVGFPCKSTNTEKKVLSNSFDMADYLALVRLEHIAEQIEMFAGIPCELHIMQEPYISEMFSVVEHELDIRILNFAEYKESLLRVLGTCPHLRIGMDLTVEYEAAKATQEPIAIDEEKEKILQNLFAGELDHPAVNDKLALRGITSKSKREEERKRLGLLMTRVSVLGTTVFGALSKAHPLYGSMLHLSANGDATKAMINFLHTPGEDPQQKKCVPWHAALLCDYSAAEPAFSLKRLNQMPAGTVIAEQAVAGTPLLFMLKR